MLLQPPCQGNKAWENAEYYSRRLRQRVGSFAIRSASESMIRAQFPCNSRNSVNQAYWKRLEHLMGFKPVEETPHLLVISRLHNFLQKTFSVLKSQW